MREENERHVLNAFVSPLTGKQKKSEHKQKSYISIRCKNAYFGQDGINHKDNKTRLVFFFPVPLMANNL